MLCTQTCIRDQTQISEGWIIIVSISQLRVDRVIKSPVKDIQVSKSPARDMLTSQSPVHAAVTLDDNPEPHRSVPVPSPHSIPPHEVADVISASSPPPRDRPPATGEEGPPATGEEGPPATGEEGEQREQVSHHSHG